MFEKHAKKGRLVYVAGKLQTRKWRKDSKDSDRFSTEILLVPGGRVQFLDKPNGEATPPAASGPANRQTWTTTSRFKRGLLPPAPTGACSASLPARNRPFF